MRQLWNEYKYKVDQRQRPGALRYQDEGEEEDPAKKNEKEQPVRQEEN